MSDSWTARQQRQLSYVAEFTSNIVHVPGRFNLVADLLSRPPQTATAPDPATTPVQQSSPSPPASTSLPTEEALEWAAAAAVTSEGVDLAAMAKEQHGCPATQQLLNSSSLHIIQIPVGHQKLLCDMSSGRRRPLVPTSWQRQVFNSLHSLAHPGIRASRRMISTRFVWKGMAADVGRWCRDCLHCQRAKITTNITAPVEPIPVPAQRFSHIHVDLVGPLQASSDGHTHIMTIIDRSTRWVEAIPLSSTTATACADALVAGWFSRFGVPLVMVTDRGVQFTSAVWAVLCQRLGIRHSTTTAYHPQSNGMIERFHRQLKNSLRARLASTDWPSHLPWVLLGLRAAPKEDHNVSAAELLYGIPLALPGQLVDTAEPPAATFLDLLRRPPSTSLPTRPLTGPPPAQSPPAKLMATDFVFVKRGASGLPLSPLYDGPYLVTAKGPKYFTLQVGNRLDQVSVDRLKPCLATEISPADPPRRGRPPGSSTEPRPTASILGGGHVAAPDPPSSGRNPRTKSEEIRENNY